RSGDRKIHFFGASSREERATCLAHHNGFPHFRRSVGGTTAARHSRVDDQPDLLPRAHRFAMDSIAFYRKLPDTKLAQALGVQYVRSSTSVNSNYRAARRARSTKEFIAKLGNVVE